MPKRGNWQAERPPRRRRDSDADKDNDDDDNIDQYRAQPDDLVKPPGIEPFGPSPPFGVLVSLYEQFENATRNKHKKAGFKGELLRNYFLEWRKSVGPDLYPLVRLLLPERDTRRRTYNLKEAKLAKAIITALDLPPKNDSALKLTNWKTPTKEDPGAGEFASVAYEVIRTRSTVLSSRDDFTIDDVNSILDDLSHTTGIGADGQKLSLGAEHARLIKACIQKMTAGEMKWMIRIILRDLKIGIGEKTIFNQLHPDAMEVFNTCSDIKRVCWRLYNPAERIAHEDWTVKPGSFFRPMLAWRARSLKDVAKAMRANRPRRDPEYKHRDGEYKGDEFIIEEKLDGERMQLHKVGDEFQYASRKAKAYTYLYGKNYTEGSLTPFIKDAFVEGVEEVILDGEMLVWDPSMHKYMPFGNLKTFAMQRKDHFDPQDARPCFKVFDILYIKGTSGTPQPLLHNALWDRKQLLHKVLKPIKGVIEIADCATGTSLEDIRDQLTRILEDRGEGLVVKHPFSMYTLGSREQAWIKIKPEYMDSLGETIDGVVIGGYWGQGSRARVLASYMIGLRSKMNGRFVYHTFAKIGSGYTRADYQRIQEEYGSKFFDYNRNSPPSWFHTVSEWPDQLINPADSFVIEVKASEIVGGAEYGAGMTLRFPRCIRIRWEKDVEDGMDLDTARTYRNTGPKKRQLDGDFSAKEKKTTTSRASKKARSVAADLGQIQHSSSIFEGIVFYVHTVVPGLKTDLEKKILEGGGRYIQQIPSSNIDAERLVVASEFKGIKSKKGSKEVDIVKPEWVTESVEKCRRMPFYKRFFHQAIPATQALRVYEANEDEEDLMRSLESDEDQEEEKPNPKDVKPSSTPSASPPPMSYRDRLAEYGEDAEDSEDEPVTENERDDEDDGDDGWEKVSGGESQNTVASGVRDMQLDAKVTQDGTASSAELASATSSTGTSGQAGDIAVNEEEKVEDDEEDDPMRPFKRMVAYFDTNDNALSNELAVSTASTAVQKRADKKLLAAKEGFVEGGGVATDELLNPTLTHIVVTKLVPDRYKALINRTKEPAYRRIVTSDWIDDSRDEGTAVDETDYLP
ncbi:hypothetical protein JCM11251_002654 [Rhodosporidiobolus azoricus]